MNRIHGRPDEDIFVAVFGSSLFKAMDAFECSALQVSLLHRQHTFGGYVDGLSANDETVVGLAVVAGRPTIVFLIRHLSICCASRFGAGDDMLAHLLCSGLSVVY